MRTYVVLVIADELIIDEPVTGVTEYILSDTDDISDTDIVSGQEGDTDMDGILSEAQGEGRIEIRPEVQPVISSGTEHSDVSILEPQKSDVSDQDDEVIVEVENEVMQASGFADEDDLFAMYADKEFGVEYFEDKSIPSPVRGGRAYIHLNSNELKFYNKAVEMMEAVANGEASSTDIYFTPSEMGLEDISDVDVTDLFDCTLKNNEWNKELNNQKYNQGFDLLSAQVNVDQKKVLDALYADHPEWLYWFGRSYSIGIGYITYGATGLIKKTSATTGTQDGYIRVKNYRIFLSVAKSYAVYKEGSATSYYTDKADTNKTGATKTAVAKAESIAAEYSALGDYDKLLAFKEKICAMVTYNQ